MCCPCVPCTSLATSSVITGDPAADTKFKKKALEQMIRLCSSRKYPFPPQGMLMEIPRGRGASKTQFFVRKYDTKMEFPEGWGGGVQLKTLPWEGYG